YSLVSTDSQSNISGNIITFTPSTSGTANIQYKATDSIGGYSAVGTIVVTVYPTVVPTPPANVQVTPGASSNTWTIPLSGGNDPYIASVEPIDPSYGTIELNKDGTITYTPPVVVSKKLASELVKGSKSVTITYVIKDKTGATYTKTFTITLYDPIVVTSSAYTGEITMSSAKKPLTFSLTATGGNGTYTYSLVSTDPQSTISNNIITFTPSTSGTATIQYQGTDSNGGKSAVGSITVTVNTAIAANPVSGGQFTPGSPNETYNVTLTGGDKPVLTGASVVVSGNGSVTFDATAGTITYSPPAAPSSLLKVATPVTINFTAGDNFGGNYTGSFTISLNDKIVVTPSATTGSIDIGETPLTFTLSASGGNGTYTYSLVSTDSQSNISGNIIT
ncbi:MAG: hypothetical protein AAB356_08365, partial [Deltaproteobacteria bacterium]